MNVLIAGANGKIGRRVVRLLADSNHSARAMVRDMDQSPGLERLGAYEVVVADLERDLSEAVRGVQAVVFAAGSGPHTGPDKTLDVDRDGAIRLIDAARNAGVERFVMVSAMRTNDPDGAPEKLRHYLRAKAEADHHLMESGLPYTIIQPGRLTEEHGTGLIAAGTDIGYGEIPRDDVAAVIVAALDEPHSVNRRFGILEGETPVAEALARV